MTKDPYEVLGIDRTATPDEVKRAYRKKARENHPDLNPNDPDASKRMNEVNEAYDRIMNPEKYAASDRRASAAQGARGSAAEGGGRGSYGTGGSQGGYAQEGNPYSQSGPYGWTGFDFDDLFGFGGFGSSDSAPIHPEPSPNDSPTVRSAIGDINAARFERAVSTLNTVVSAQRDARWHYLVAIANHGAGNALSAAEHIRKAVRMDPGNESYLAAQRKFQNAGAVYEQQGEARGFSVSTTPVMLCLGIWCCAPTVCRFCTPGYGFHI